jgi:hypothetical protein
MNAYIIEIEAAKFSDRESFPRMKIAMFMRYNDRRRIK